MPNAPVIGQAGQPTYTVSWSASVTAPNAEMAAAEALEMIIEGKLAAREFVVSNPDDGTSRTSTVVDLFHRGRAAQLLAATITDLINRPGYEVTLVGRGRLRKVACAGVAMEFHFHDDIDELSTDFIYLDFITAELSPVGDIVLQAYEPGGRLSMLAITAERRQRVPLDDVIAGLT